MRNSLHIDVCQKVFSSILLRKENTSNELGELVFVLHGPIRETCVGTKQ